MTLRPTASRAVLRGELVDADVVLHAEARRVGVDVVEEAAAAVVRLDVQRRAELVELAEAFGLETCGGEEEEEEVLGGRVSGSLEWRRQRGELGSSDGGGGSSAAASAAEN